jgi:hypothetical protein
MFRRNVLAPSSGLKGSPSKQQALKITSHSPMFFLSNYNCHAKILEFMRVPIGLKAGCNFRGSQTLSYYAPLKIIYYIYVPPPISPTQRSRIPHILVGLHQTVG